MEMKPILFNTEMVRAILDGRKTVTRRVVKPQPGNYGLEYGHAPWKRSPSPPCWHSVGREYKPPYRPGDVLYVREMFGTWARTEGLMPSLYYKADGNAPDTIKWRPSIHMPREAARLFLRVTGVRVELLQDITEEQARAEGFSNDIDLIGGAGKSAARHFADLWDSTVKKSDLDLYGWAANPWVWVIEFERCEKLAEVE